MFTPLVGAPMENSLDLVIVWAMYGSFMRKTFWPMPNTCPSGQERTPWLTRWARATFEQGCLSVLRTWKVHAKRCPCQVNTCSRLAAFFLIACACHFFMLLGKPRPGNR